MGRKAARTYTKRTHTIEGVEKTVSQWSRELGVPYDTLYSRWFRGWTTYPRSPRAKARKRKKVRQDYKARKRAGLCTQYGCASAAALPFLRCEACRAKKNERSKLAKRDMRRRDAEVLAIA